MLRIVQNLLLFFSLLISTQMARPDEGGLVINAPIRQINKSGDNIVANQILQVYLQVGETETRVVNANLDQRDEAKARELIALLHAISVNYEEVNETDLDYIGLADDLLTASEAILIGDYQAATLLLEDIISRGPQILTSTAGKNLLRDAVLGRASIYEIKGDIQAAISVLKSGIEALPDSHELQSNLARTYAFDGNLGRARAHLRRSLRWAEIDKDTSATILRWHGDAFQDLFDFSASIEAYKAAERTHIRTATTNTKDYAYLVQNLASVLARSAEFEEAQKYYEKAYVLQYKLNISELDRLQMHNNLALFYLGAGCFRVALKHANHALGSSILETEDPITLAFVGRTAARSEMMLKNLEAAIQQHNKAETKLRTVLRDEHWRHAQFLIMSAEMHRVSGELTLAQEEISEAISRLDSVERKPWRIYIQALIELHLIENSNGIPLTKGALVDITRKASVLQRSELAEIEWKLEALAYLEWSTNREGDPPEMKSILESGYSISYVLNDYLPNSEDVRRLIGDDAMRSSRSVFDQNCESAIRP